MIRIQDGFSVRKVLDVYIIVGTGKDAYMPNCIMSLNETGAFLWDILVNGSDRETLIAKLVDAYEVSDESAARDVDTFLAQLTERALIKEC